MKCKIVFFDCDGVLTLDPLWPKLHKAVGLPEKQDEEWFAEYYAGKLSFDQWVKNIVDFYLKQKLNKKLLEGTLSDIKINPEAYEIITYLKKRKIKTAIISSGIDYYIEKVAKILKTDYWRANATFHFDKKGLFTKLDYLTDDPTAKVLQVKEICNLLNINPTETIFVGDSDNDLKAFKLTEHGVLYKSKNKDHKKIAWKTISNLIEIKKIIENYLSS